jgi:hypothetical protein
VLEDVLSRGKRQGKGHGEKTKHRLQCQSSHIRPHWEGDILAKTWRRKKETCEIHGRTAFQSEDKVPKVGMCLAALRNRQGWLEQREQGMRRQF